MKSILFATDFTASSQPALDWLRLFARQYGATVTVLHAFQPILPDATLPTMGEYGAGVEASLDLEEISQQHLNGLAETLRAEGFTIQTEWRVGGVESEIIDVAQEQNADLIITGRSDLSTFFDRLAGSAATDVAADAPCPVLVIPAEATGPAQVQNVVLTASLQTSETSAFQQVAQLARTFGATLTVLKVNAENQPNVFDDDEVAQEFRAAYGADTLRIETIEARTVTDGLDDYLHAHPADIVAMTYHERGFFENLFRINYTERMLERTHRPVLVYHDK